MTKQQSLTPEQLAEVYDEMADEEETWGGLSYLYDFVQTVSRLNSMRDAFTVKDIDAVEAMWSDYDADFWEGGFVIRLADGHRAYLESVDRDGDWKDGARVSVEMVPDDLRYPPLGPDRFQTLFGWTEPPALFGEFLRRLRVVDGGWPSQDAHKMQHIN